MISRSQRAFINRALPVLKKDKRIVGVALSGAYSGENTEERTGLEFIIVVNTAQYDDVLSDMASIAASLGKLLAFFPADHIQKPEQLICMFEHESIHHVDLDFQPLDKISARLTNPEILYEKDGLLTHEFSKAPVIIPSPDLQWYEDRFWIWVHYITNNIRRGELFDAIEGLSFLRQRVLGPLMQLKNGKPPSGVRNIEATAPAEIPRLVATLAEHNPKSCLRALKSAADLYIYLRGYNISKLLSREDAQRRALQYLNTISDTIV